MPPALVRSNFLRLSGRPHVQPDRDELFCGRSNRGLERIVKGGCGFYLFMAARRG